MPGNYCKLKTGGQKTETFKAGDIAKQRNDIEQKQRGHIEAQT